MSTRPAAAAEQSDPRHNRHFRRAWGVPITTGPDAAGIVAWHASDVCEPPMSPARMEAEAAWLTVTRRPGQ